MTAVMLSCTLVAVALVLVVRLLGRRRGTPAYEDEPNGHHFHIVEPLEALRSVVEYVVQRGEGWLMIEGAFRQVNSAGLPVTSQPPAMLKKQTVWSFPKEQILVVPLSRETLSAVSESMLPSMVAEAEHVQVADGNRLMFGAYDQYEVAWAPAGGLPVEVLRLLEPRGVIARLEGIENDW